MDILGRGSARGWNDPEAEQGAGVAELERTR